MIDPAETLGGPRLPRPPGVLRRFLAEYPLVVDGTIAGGYLFGCLLMATIDGVEAEGLPNYLTFPLILLTFLKTLVVFLSLLWRRRFPLIGLIAIALVAIVPLASQEVADSTALLFALYAVPVYGTVRRGWIGYAVTVPVAVLQTHRDHLAYGNGYTVIIPAVLVSLVILMFGINMGNRRRWVQAIIDRAHQLALERDQRARLAVSEERSRIAREMHDIVAHSLSVMVTLSEGAARSVEAAPAAAADAMLRGAETGRTALAEMRRLLGVLAEDAGAGALAPQPGTAQLPELVASYRVTGLRITLTERGVPTTDRGQELAVFRVVQESLTNALRHAGIGASVEVTLEYQRDRTIVEVYNSGGGAPRPGGVAALGSGRGLEGLRQRLTIFGGTLSAGPQGAGWLVRAVVPVSEEAVDTAALPREGAPT